MKSNTQININPRTNIKRRPGNKDDYELRLIAIGRQRQFVDGLVLTRRGNKVE